MNDDDVLNRAIDAGRVTKVVSALVIALSLLGLVLALYVGLWAIIPASLTLVAGLTVYRLTSGLMLIARRCLGKRPEGTTYQILNADGKSETKIFR